MLDQVVDDRTAAKVQMVDASLKILITVVGEQCFVPPLGFWRNLALDDW